jgi:magnesium-transporting ATPase (P-type)
MGGTEQILANLEVSLDVGIKESEKEARETAFGTNYREPAKANSWFSFLMQQLGDTMLIILICAAIVSLLLSYATVPPEDYGHAWIEGGGILIAVAVVSITGSTVDYRKEVEFVKQTNDAGAKDTCLVLRDGKIKEIHHDLVVTGDIIELQVGVETPVDGIVLSCNQLQTNEAAMTGESDERKKETFRQCWDRLQDKNTLTEKNTYHPNANDAHSISSPVILSGTSCAGGEGRYLALVVGEDSALGQILKTSQKRPQTTPLEEKLDEIAHKIGIVGVVFALLTVHGLMLIYFIDGLRYRNVDLFGGESEGEGLFFANLKIWVDYFIIGVAIIVVAVPEGLPLAVMISLAVSIKRMLVDKNYVKRLASCEIMGGADNICSDKTGTLTMNKMTVTDLFIGKTVHIDETAVGEGKDKVMTTLDLQQVFGDIFLGHIVAGVACNTPDRESAGATDKAMFELMDRGQVDMEAIKAMHNVAKKGEYIRFPFSSKRKRMSTIIENAQDGASGYNKRLLIKGASEIVKACCSHYLDAEGVRQAKDDIMDEKFNGIINEFATKALRTIVIAYKDI